MPTTRDIIVRAGRAAGVFASGETPNASEEMDCLAILQRFRNGLGAQRGAIYEERRVTHGLTSGTRDYTIGPVGAIAVARPTWIDRAGLILDDTVTDPIEIPIAVLTPAQWASLSLKTLDGQPSAIFYDHAFGATQLGTISVYPTPDSSDQALALYLPMAGTGFEALTTQYLFPSGYEDMYHFNLAERIAIEFQRPVPAHITRLACETLMIVKMANHRPVELPRDGSAPGLTGGRGSSSSQIERTLSGG